MIASNKLLLAELEVNRTRLIQAYTAGVLSLDELAIQKTDIEKQINDLQLAVQDLQAELDPKLLSMEDIASIEEIAAHVREATGLTDDDPKTQHMLFQLLDVNVMLSCKENQRWADLECVFGQQRLSTGYNTTLFIARKSGK